MSRILYLAHNLSDPAVARRVRMLQLGGADVSVAGFRRGREAAAAPPDDGYIELGSTYDARFTQRLLSVASAWTSIVRRLRGVPRPDIIVARNLEMLALANRLRNAWAIDASVVYECLDIHRLMLRRGPIGRAMRTVERMLARDASLLLTSSPAFLREYFEPYGQFDQPVLLVENKVLFDAGNRGQNPALAAPEAVVPLRIGWFGVLRCRRSLSILSTLTRQAAGGIEVVLRGKPALVEFEDFDGFVASEPHLRFEGPYRNPDDLAAIYSEVQFAWAIDYFEAGLNSKWLLPNRIYEGCLHGAIPIALAGTETAALLDRLHIGIVLDDTEPETLARVFAGMSGARIAALARAVANVDIGHFACSAVDCRALVARLEALRVVGEAAAMVPA